MKYTINKHHDQWFVCSLNDILKFRLIYSALVEDNKQKEGREVEVPA